MLTKEDDSDSITDVNFKAYMKHGVGGLWKMNNTQTEGSTQT